MKKAVLTICLLLIVCVIVACGGGAENALSSEVQTSSLCETSSAENSVITECEQTSSSLSANSTEESYIYGGGADVCFEWYYPSELHELSILADITDWDKVEKYAEGEYKDLHPNGVSQLPPIYEFVKRFGISKDAFSEANKKCSEYTDEQIELMFGDYDEETIKQKLKADTTFYYEGTLYNVYEICSMDKSSLETISDKEGLVAYLNVMKSILENHGDGSYYSEEVDKILSELQ